MPYVQVSQHNIHGASQVYDRDLRRWVNSPGLVYGFHSLSDLDRMSIPYRLMSEQHVDTLEFGCVLCPIIDDKIGYPVATNYDSSG